MINAIDSTDMEDAIDEISEWYCLICVLYKREVWNAIWRSTSNI
jgi:hypothetical protein